MSCYYSNFNGNLYDNTLLKLLECSDPIDIKQWDWNEISSNININILYIINHLTYPWNWSSLSCNKAISIEDIFAYPKLPWIFSGNYNYHNMIEGVSNNPNLVLTHIIEHPDIAWDWYSISKLKWITPTIIKNNILLYTRLSKYSDKYYDMPDMHNICDIYGYNPDLFINKKISLIESINKNNYKYELDWKFISSNPEINMQYIIDNPHYDWCWKSISSNPNINMQFIEDRINFKWDWNVISSKPFLTIQFIYKNLYLNWNWDDISCNINITCMDIEKYINLPWNWGKVAKNPNIKAEFIMKHSDIDWNYKILSTNQFNKHPYMIQKNNKRINYRNIVNNILKMKKINIISEIVYIIAMYI